jgi:hypothetical protein
VIVNAPEVPLKPSTITVYTVPAVSVVVSDGAPYSAHVVTEQFGSRNIPRLLEVVLLKVKV